MLWVDKPYEKQQQKNRRKFLFEDETLNIVLSTAPTDQQWTFSNK